MEERLDRRALLRGGSVAVAAAAATVGTSVMTAGPASAAPLAPIYIPVGPIRVYDSRTGGGRISRNQTRNVLAGFADPEDLAFCLNVTITQTVGASGFLSIFPGDETWGGASSINWDRPGQTVANNAYTWVGVDDGSINVRCGASTGGSTHFILDLIAVTFIADLGLLGPTQLRSKGSQMSRSIQR